MTETLLANRYKIIKKIGEGGMGKIWRVYDTIEQQEVALKQFCKKEPQEEAKDTATLETMSSSQRKRIRLSIISTSSTEKSLRFKQEFRTMVKLKHPNTVNVFDYGVLENGDEYLTMEIISGQELRDILKQRQLDFEEIYRILIQTCQVLNFIHSRLLVHRDIKPSNIRITPEGNVKLMDFGLMDQMGLPSKGEIAGTVTYLPPEVAKGGIIDARSDLYSLGVMAYELVTGRPPFLGEKTLNIIRQHIETSPIPPCQIREDTPEELEKIILTLLAKNQKERYQTTAELLNDLAQLTGEKISIETLEQRKSYLNCSELIGREREMQKIKDIFSLTSQGKGQSIFIAAPAGVGKTRLIQEFKLKVQLVEIPFMQGECFEQGMSTYQPLANAFKPLLPLAKKEVLDKYGSVLVKVIPELKSRGYQSAPKLDEVGEKVRLFEQVTGWLKEISKVSPIVICIEDLHWSDVATLELQNACIRELQDYPIMILNTFRNDEVEPSSIIFQTVEEGITQLMSLSTLDQEAVQSLIKGMLGQIELTEDFVNHIYTATGGNAFFVSEVMRTLIEEEQLQLDRGRWILPVDLGKLELPISIEATIARRLILLCPDALGLAHLAAIVGRSSDLSLLKALSGLEDEKLFETLDELIARQFMKTEEKLYIFTHDSVRETLYKQIDEGKRIELHEKAGIILEKRHRENLGIMATELAYHFSRGLNQQKAIEYLLMAGNKIFYSPAPAPQVVEYFIKADELLKKNDYPEKEDVSIDLWSKIGNCYTYLRPDLSVQYLEKSIAALHNLGNIPKVIKNIKIFFKIINLLPDYISQKIKNKFNQPLPTTQKFKGNYSAIISKIIENQCLLSLNYAMVGESDKGLSLAEETLEYIPDPKSVVNAFAKIGQIEALGQQGKVRLALSVTIETYDLLRKNEQNFKSFGPEMERQLWWVYGQVCYLLNMAYYWRGKKPPEKYFSQAFSLAEETHALDTKGLLFYCQMLRASLCGMPTQFDDAKNRFLDTVKLFGGLSEYAQLPLMAFSAYFHLQRGDFDSAIKMAQGVIRLGEKAFDVFSVTFANTILGLAYFERAKREEAIQKLVLAISLSRKHKNNRLPMALYSLGDIYLRVGDIEKAASFIQEAHQICTSDEFFNEYFQINTYRLLGQIDIEKKNFEKAKELLERSLAIAQEDENPIQQGLALLQLGRLQMKLTQYTLAQEMVQQTIDRFSNINNTYQMESAQKLLKEIEKGKQGIWKEN